MPVSGNPSRLQPKPAFRRPLALVRLTGRVVSTYVLRRSPNPPPLLASFKLTHRCNLHCRQCPFWHQPSPDLPFDQVKAALIALRSRGSRMVIFEGGEPYMWQDDNRTFNDIADTARELFDVVGVTTNGTFPLTSPTDLTWVSLDGLESTHDALRGSGVFQQAMTHIQSAQKQRVYAHLTANKLNAAELPDLVRFLKGKVRGISLQFYYPYGGVNDLWLPQDERSQLIDTVINMKRQGYPILNSIAGLRAMQRGGWRCVDSLVDNVHADGSLQQGCYLKGRAEADCARCGFTPHAEISLAYQGNLDAIFGGLRTFL